MKKLYAVLFSLLFAFGILAGCGVDNAPADENNADQRTEQNEETEQAQESEEQKGDADFPITITDALDEEVVIEEKPDRIISLIPSNTEIAFELGLEDKIVGVTDNDNYPEEVLDIEKVGGMEFNVEKIISLEPDLVLAHESVARNSAEGLKQITDTGISVFVVNDATTFDQVYQSIETIGKTTGTLEQAETITENMQSEVEEIKAKASEVSEEKSVAIEISPAPEIYVAGKNTFMDEMLSIINAENALGELEGWPKVDEEAMIEYNPDVMVTTYGFYTENAVEQVKAREGWEDVSAIKNDQVFDVHSDLLSRPGPRLVEGVQELAKVVYPKVFN